MPNAKTTFGDWKMCKAPVDYFKGGTWLAVPKGCSHLKEAKDFIKFCNNLIHYLNCEMEPFNHEKYDYPIGQIDDVLLYGLHYNSFEELKEKWDERKKRVNHDNLFIMMSERDGCTLEDIENFDRLPFENKVIFVHKPMPNIKSAHYIPNTETIENGENCVVPLSEFKEGENKRYIDDFDYISFLNKGTI